MLRIRPGKDKGTERWAREDKEVLEIGSTSNPLLPPLLG
tara:strand:+ start:450 stop:566 length:117 start_codon:yes stop_codon:yes gene_type:complete